MSTHNDGAHPRVGEQRSTLVSPTISSPQAAPGYSARDAFELMRIQLRREDGQTMTEYGVLLALIAVVVIAALLFLGPKIADVFSNVGSQL